MTAFLATRYFISFSRLIGHKTDLKQFKEFKICIFNIIWSGMQGANTLYYWRVMKPDSGEISW